MDRLINRAKLSLKRLVLVEYVSDVGCGFGEGGVMLCSTCS